MRHRAQSTITLHQTLVFAVFAASPHVFPMFSSSLPLYVYTTVLHGLPCFLLPWEFHVIVFSLSFLKVWPIHFHCLRIISIATLTVQATGTAHSSLFVMASGQKMPSIWRSLIFYSLASALFRCQVSDPDRSRPDLTLELNIINLALRERTSSCFPDRSETCLLCFPDLGGAILFCSSRHAHYASCAAKVK